MNKEDFELKRALDTYFREQIAIQDKIAESLIKVENQQRALLAIFGEAARQMSGGK